MKKLIILSTSLVLFLFLIGLTFKDNLLNNFKEEPIKVTDESLEGVLIIEEESIGNSGRRWNQTKVYDTYSIRVNNTSGQIMKVFVSSSLGGTWDFEVPANDSSTWIVKNAVSGEHQVGFVTSNGIVSGIIDVVVSGEDS